MAESSMFYYEIEVEWKKGKEGQIGGPGLWREKSACNRCLRMPRRAKGKLEKVAGSNYQITEILVKPRVVLASANDLGRIPRILEKAKESCFVSNSIKSAIKVEPEIFHQRTQTSPCSLG